MAHSQCKSIPHFPTTPSAPCVAVGARRMWKTMNTNFQNLPPLKINSSRNFERFLGGKSEGLSEFFVFVGEKYFENKGFLSFS